MDEVAPRKIKYRVGWGEFFILVFFAGIADLLSIIPFVGMIVGPIFWFFFGMYRILIKGISIKKGDLLTVAISAILEFIPLVSILPTIMFGVVRILLKTRAEDKIKFIKEQRRIEAEKNKSSSKSPSRINPRETSTSPSRSDASKVAENTPA